MPRYGRDLRTGSWELKEDGSGHLEIKDSAVNKLEVQSDGVINSINGVQIDPHIATATQCKVIGGDTAGDDLKIFANSSDAYPTTIWAGGGRIINAVTIGQDFRVNEAASVVLEINRTGSSYATDATSQTAWDFNMDSITTGKGVLVRGGALTTGNLVELTADYDTVTTGRLLMYKGGTAENYPLWWIDKYGREPYYDDFLGDALRDEWNGAQVGAGTAPAILADGENGICELAVQTSVTSDSSTLDFSNKNYLSNNHPILIAYVMVDDISESDSYIGFYKDADEYAYFHLDQGTIMLKADDGGVDTYSADSGLTVTDNTWVELCVDVSAAETPTFYVDGTVVGTPTVGSVTTAAMTPYFHHDAMTTNPSSFYIDYVKICSERA